MRLQIDRLNLFIIGLTVISTIATLQLPSTAKEEYRDFQDESDRSLSDWYQRRASYHQRKALEYRKQAQFEAEMNEYELDDPDERKAEQNSEEQQDPNLVE
jgi:hypothetical protein